ncbi:sugar phosphate isomerase/epimerase family protein [Microbacterium sp. gxy059]|uniref:sugar phosphate isomerase/epimerase family protein n=1 Tax=Microbacterium sp. gxy059 TaxID=2957199 RepID=UPI003D99FF67
MQIGAHAQVFTGSLDESGITRAITATRRAGFDILEIPMMDPKRFDRALAARLLAEHDIEATASLGLTAATDLTSPDPAVRVAGEEMLETCIDIVHALGGRWLTGVIYSAMRKYMEPATEEGVAHAADALRRLADRAAGKGIRLGLEIVNRYESNVANTARGGLALLDRVDHENVSLHLDTYHMNIEESDMAQPVLDAGDALGYVHIGESHRGYLGSGTVDFDGFFRGLARAGYDGPVVFESFSSAIVSAELSNTLGVWRNLWDDSDDLAAHANAFIRGQLRAVDTIRLH